MPSGRNTIDGDKLLRRGDTFECYFQSIGTFSAVMPVQNLPVTEICDLQHNFLLIHDWNFSDVCDILYHTVTKK